MATTENERLELYELAKHEVGDRFAELMMKSLPPEPDDLARSRDILAVKVDLAAVEQRLDAKIDVLGADLRVEMRELTVGQTRTLMLGMVGSVTALSITQTIVTLLGR